MMGVASIKQEGAPVHPDDVEGEMSDDAYVRQLQAYKDHFKLSFSDPSIAYCTRNELVRDLR